MIEKREKYHQIDHIDPKVLVGLIQYFVRFRTIIMSSDSTLNETIPVQDSTLKSKLLPNLVIRTPSKCGKESIVGIVILIMALSSAIVFSTQIQNLIESDAEFERRHISLDQDFDDHDEKIDALENKVSLLVQKIEHLAHQLNASGKTFIKYSI